MLTTPEIVTFRQTLQALLAKRQATANALANETHQELHVRGEHTLPERPDRQADPHSDEVEQEIDLALLENAEMTVHEIEAALERVGKGTFGLCTVCEKPITKTRLAALPATRYCIHCVRNMNIS